MKQQLLYCPRCKLDGRDKVIAGLMNDGTICITRQRTKMSFEETTFVRGKDFELICGYCRSVVYIRKEGMNESGSKRIIWLHRVTLSPGTVIQGIFNNTGNAGTSLFTQGSQ